MIRIVLTQIALFALPFVAFFVYRVATRGVTGAMVAGTGRATFGLVLAGAALVVASFVWLAVTGGAQRGVYVPTQYRDGVLVPGGFRPREETPASSDAGERGEEAEERGEEAEERGEEAEERGEEAEERGEDTQG